MSGGVRGRGPADTLLRDEYESKVARYAQALTPEVVALVRDTLPPGGRLLDVGCGTGNLLRQFRGQASFLAGIDVAASACDAARAVADLVVNEPVESEAIPFDDHSFDVVVCADVLEHLVDPAAGLARAADWCTTGGAVVVSVPNIAYWQARLRLLRGVWKYEDVGIFDDGHLRFFTLGTLRLLVAGAGLEIVAYRPVLREFWHNLRGFRRLPDGVQRPVERAWAGWGLRRPTLLAYQHVCVCRRVKTASDVGEERRPPQATGLPVVAQGVHEL